MMKDGGQRSNYLFFVGMLCLDLLNYIRLYRQLKKRQSGNKTHREL